MSGEARRRYEIEEGVGSDSSARMELVPDVVEGTVHAGKVPGHVPILGPSSELIDWAAFLPPRACTFRWRFAQGVKRLMDILVSGVGLVLLLPVFVVLPIVIRLTSRGPGYYRWSVLGQYARPFRGFKFRSMVVNADELKESMAHLNHMQGPAFKVRNDPRVTPVGRFLRKFSIDELPQLWSVFKGDMSLVGPRPPFPEEYERFKPWHRAKLSVKPGVTCLWQISGRSDIHDFEQWVELDMRYIREWSLWLDLKILMRTIPVVSRGSGAY
ncbi:MAG: sugar transferase [Gemmatimonadetes bacterium]|nr:sugar transferase [Gemmatimonadota bacterium]